jgi:hypothetical protein
MRVPWENMEDFRTFSFRGLSQGDLPSPLLFDIVGDVLGAMISGAISRCHLSGLERHLIEGEITHMHTPTVIFLEFPGMSIATMKFML